MKFSEFNTEAMFQIGDESLLEKYRVGEQLGVFTFIWARQNSARVIVDNIPIRIPQHSILALTPLQFLQFEAGKDLIVYQFNRSFYCIQDHDKEVGCAGSLFFGDMYSPIIPLDDKEQKSYSALHSVFIEEFENKDAIQSEMLRMLLSRFIIKTTRLLKSESASEAITDNKQELVRQFNLLVEAHFKKEHSVAFYAGKLNKSPKTISNIFSKLKKTPLKIIHDRIILEAKRQFIYTNKTSKEIAYDIGFDDASHLSRMFKKQTGSSPTHFRLKSTIN
ncbi:helix-turn-helix domain-containing protein [Ulvibacter antarcticus]|uniref:AraC family transcriptional regulator n=1 Tax=Ulvibacter antarcticus TaxID=442714 RepID=A0A3L9Z2D8_9FLAO|nr:helix-turn-helix domain-containing protein [Ulvibacter antarcticus]RMA66167.1 AraC family transcriptional regulator [Ulvibacter antarcticus]